MTLNDIITKFDTIKKEWSKDSQIDFQFKGKEYTEDLGRIALNIPYQHNKYLNYYTDFSHIKTMTEIQLRRTTKEKREYYSGEADAKTYAEKPFGTSIKTQDKMKTYLDADEDLLVLEAKLSYINQVLYFLDSVMKQITNRGFQIKSAIDWEKFINGVT